MFHELEPLVAVYDRTVGDEIESSAVQKSDSKCDENGFLVGSNLLDIGAGRYDQSENA
jgi:hypothetical protein